MLCEENEERGAVINDKEGHGLFIGVFAYTNVNFHR